MRTTQAISGSITAAAFLLAAPAVYGAGFQINEHSARATGRAGAVVATVDDASSVFYNPAGLAEIEGTAIQVGAALIRPTSYMDGNGPAGIATGQSKTEQGFIPVPNAYVARALSEKAFVGIGFYAPYGLGIQWADSANFVGRTTVEELELRSFFLTPTIALKLSEAVSVAVSVSLVPATVYLRRTLGASDNDEILFPKANFPGATRDGFVELSGSAFGVGANAGVQIKLIEHLRLGVSFRSAVGLDFSGTADFELPPGVPASVQARFPDGDVRAEVTLPHSFAAGIGWDQGALTVEVAANLTLWSSVEELRIDFDSGLPSPTTAAPRDWETAPTVRAGAEYRFLDGMLPVRLGFAWDKTPVPDRTIDPVLPDSDRLIFTGGVGTKIGPVTIDAGYMLLLLSERVATDSVNFPDVTYPSREIHLLTATVGMEI